jgi:hypothetical protein
VSLAALWVLTLKGTDPMNYKVTLTGHDTASCPELGLVVTRKKHGVIDMLARKMIQAGAHLDDTMEVYRGETLCFKRCAIRSWAGMRLYERDQSGFVLVRHSTDSLEALQRSNAEGTPTPEEHTGAHKAPEVQLAA